MEMWKDIPEYEGLYQVSNFGNVRSVERVAGKNNTTRNIKGTSIEMCIDKGGYLFVRLWSCNSWKNFKVHRLVLRAFRPSNNDILDVNHIDGNKKNNRISNLEWCTRAENHYHAIKLGLRGTVLCFTAKKQDNIIEAESIGILYHKIKKAENIICTEKTFKNNVYRALSTKGLYYGYTFEGR